MADVDLLTPDEAGDVLRDEATNGSLFLAAVTGMSRALAAYCGPIVQETVTDEQHRTRGESSLWVRRWPVTTFTTVTEYDGASSQTLTAETPGTTPTAGYYPEPYTEDSATYSGLIWRRSAGTPDTFPANGYVVVTYTAGRFATTGAVTENFKHAARITLENWWQQFRNGADLVVADEGYMPTSPFPRYAIPNAARQLLADEVHETDVMVG